MFFILYSFIEQVTLTEPTCLDHYFHTFPFSIPDTHTTHIDKRFHSIDSETLQDFPERYLFRWRADKAQAYTTHIEGDVSSREAFDSAVTDQDAERACACLKS
eukprot:271665-Pelagomonas_calceolata.AAC.1